MDDTRKMERTLAAKPYRLGLVKKNQACFFRRITPALARKYPRYKTFIGFFLVMESTDHLEQGTVVSESMIYREQQHHGTAA